MLIYTRVGMLRSPAGGGVITRDARTFLNQAGTGDPHTFDHTLGGSSDFLVVKIGYENTRTIVDVKVGGSGGSSLTKVTGSARNVSGVIFSEIWYIASPPTGTQQIWMDLSANGGNFGAEAVSLIGVDQSSPIVDSGGGTNTSANNVTLDAALVVSGTNRLEAIACDGYGSTGAYTWNGSIDKDVEQNVGAANVTAAHQDEVSSNITPSVSRTPTSVQNWVLSAILLKAA